MEFGKIEREGICEKIIGYIKAQILNGTFTPGDRFPSEDTLAVQMGVGRGTIREALKVLVYSGFLVKKNNRTYVSSTGMKGFAVEDVSSAIHRFEGYMEIIEVRRVIEPELAYLAAARGSPEMIAELEKCLLSMENRKEDLEKFIEYDNSFHLVLVKAAGNALFTEIMKSIQKVMKENQAQVIRDSKIAPRSLEYHRRIFDAVKAGESAKARKITLSHIMDIEKEMRILFNKGKKKES